MVRKLTGRMGEECAADDGLLSRIARSRNNNLDTAKCAPLPPGTLSRLTRWTRWAAHCASPGLDRLASSSGLRPGDLGRLVVAGMAMR